MTVSNSTTVMYGTAWSDNTLLACMRAHNLELQRRDGVQRHFEYNWQTLAQINARYRSFVEGEMRRLGEDHISIRTQYRLLPISGAGFLLNDLQQHLVRGTQPWLDDPDEDAAGFYVAGLDVGGEERPRPGDEVKPSSKRDSTVLTIGRVLYNELDLPALEIVHQAWWTGMRYNDQYASVSSLLQHWNIRHLVIDSTGLGEVLASLLIDKFGPERVNGYKFSRTSKSHLTYQLLSLINSARLKLYRQEDAPASIFDECWKQLRLARYRVPGEHVMDMYVDPAEGHDDFLMSVALCSEAVRDFLPPPLEGLVVRPRRLYRDDGRF